MLYINDSLVCPDCEAYIQDNGFCSNGHYIKFCNEECWFFKWDKCKTEYRNGLCDKPDKYEMWKWKNICVMMIVGWWDGVDVILKIKMAFATNQKEKNMQWKQMVVQQDLMDNVKTIYFEIFRIKNF